MQFAEVPEIWFERGVESLLRELLELIRDYREILSGSDVTGLLHTRLGERADIDVELPVRRKLPEAFPSPRSAQAFI